MQDVCCDFQALVLLTQAGPNDCFDKTAHTNSRLALPSGSGSNNHESEMHTMDPSYAYTSLSLSESEDEEDDGDDDLVPRLRSWEHNLSILDDSVTEAPIHSYHSRQQGTCPLGHQEIILFKG